MPYRICKTFRVENAHMLSKHPEKCRHPHGHSCRVEVVLRSETLNASDMICDFAAIKRAVGEFIATFDHAINVNSQDPFLPALQTLPHARVNVFPAQDPTTEVLARHLFERIRDLLRRTPAENPQFRIGENVVLERIRVWETPDSWAEYGE